MGGARIQRAGGPEDPEEGGCAWGRRTLRCCVGYCGTHPLERQDRRAAARAHREALRHADARAPSVSIDPRSGVTRRDHRTPNTARWAVTKATIREPVSCQTLRHGFASHLPESGAGIRSVQELQGHKSVETTGNCTHVTASRTSGVKSPPTLPGV